MNIRCERACDQFKSYKDVHPHLLLEFEYGTSLRGLFVRKLNRELVILLWKMVERMGHGT